MSTFPSDPLERLSAEFDSGRISTASREVLGDEAVDSAVLAWTDLRQELRSLPVKRAALSAAIRQQVQTDRTLSKHANATESSRVAAAVATVAALLVLFVATIRFAENSSVRNAHSAIVRSVLGIDQKNWNVIVVTIPESRHAAVRGRIRDSVLKRGLAVESVRHSDLTDNADHPDVFISTADSASDVLLAVEAELAISDSVLRHQEAEEFDREQLLRRFRQSMESPTRSDQYFGEMLVVLTDRDSVAVSKSPLEEVVADRSATRNPSAPPDHALGKPAAGTSAMVQGAEISPNRPVMLVLVREKAKPQGEHINWLPPADAAGHPDVI